MNELMNDLTTLQNNNKLSIRCQTNGNKICFKKKEILLQRKKNYK